jgi:hypothetical protein
MHNNSSSLLNVRCDAMRDCALLDHAVYHCAQQRTVSNVVLRISSEPVVRPVIGMVNAWVRSCHKHVSLVFSFVVAGMSTCPSCNTQFKNKTTCKACGENVRFLRFQDRIENDIVRDQYSNCAVRACMSVSLEVASAENIASQGPSGISQRAMREHVHEEHVASVRAIMFEPSFVCVHDAHGLIASNSGALRPRNHRVRRESA